MEYIDEENNQTLQGYVHNDYLNDDQQIDTVENEANDTTETVQEKVKEDETKKDKNSIALAKESETLYGIAAKDKTKIYEKQSKDSKVLKSYAAGSNLKYQSLNATWYEATVFVKGKPVTGYIHSGDVENKVTSQKVLRGVAVNAPTHVYAKASTNAKSLRSYGAGSVLKYKTFTENWYEATVILNGKRTTGYIHKSHVDNAVSKQENLRGIALKKSTAVFASPSTSAKKLRSYSNGTILKYKSFTDNWYEATVILKGKRTTGYIHRSHVDNVVSKQENLQGVAQKKGTPIHKKATKSSDVLRTYKYGTVLKFKSFTTDWYEAVIFINGKRTISYIHKDDVESMNYRFKGFAHKNPTKIYSEPSNKSGVLRSYDRGSNLIYRAFNSKWHTVSVKIKGKYETGYLQASDVSFEMRDLLYKTTYDYDYKAMADRQAKKKPNADGGGKINATRGQIEFYSNPLNFPSNTDEHFQFLVLSQPAGVSAKQINSNILNGNAGVLKGQAKAFIDAGKQLKINEVYLIAHALHETGNGKSILASGIPVDKEGKVTRDSKGKMTETKKTVATVYNMFGNGALTSCPIDCGAKYAFDNKWFTVKDAIVGGVNDISKYINRGQDTLYKMRWNPIGGTPNPPFEEWRQYATHIQWATITTKRIAQMYNLLEDYTLEMDVPTFNNMPDYKKGALATTTANAKFRSGASKTSGEIATIKKGSDVLIVGSNVNESYKVKYDGKTGWIDAKHVKLKY